VSCLKKCADHMDLLGNRLAVRGPGCVRWAVGVFATYNKITM